MQSQTLALFFARTLVTSILIAGVAAFLFSPLFAWSVPVLVIVSFLVMCLGEAAQVWVLMKVPGVAAFHAKQLEVISEQRGLGMSSSEMFGLRVVSRAGGEHLRPEIFPTLRDAASKKNQLDAEAFWIKKVSPPLGKGSPAPEPDDGKDRFAVPVRLTILERALDEQEEKSFKLHTDKIREEAEKQYQQIMASPPRLLKPEPVSSWGVFEHLDASDRRFPFQLVGGIFRSEQAAAESLSELSAQQPEKKLKVFGMHVTPVVSSKDLKT